METAAGAHTHGSGAPAAGEPDPAWMAAAADELLAGYLNKLLAFQANPADPAPFVEFAVQAAGDIIRDGWDVEDRWAHADMSTIDALAEPILDEYRHYSSATYGPSDHLDDIRIQFEEALYDEADWAVTRLAQLFIGLTPASMAHARELARELRERRDRSRDDVNRQVEADQAAYEAEIKENAQRRRQE